MGKNSEVKNLSYINFEEEVLGSERPVLVEFVTEWSGACHIIGPVIEELQSDFGDKVKFYRIDGEKEKSIATAYGIQGYPTLLFFKDGDVKDYMTGAVSKKMLAEKLGWLIRND